MRDDYSLCTLAPMEKCAVCGKQGKASAIPRCSRCKMIRYCSRACQSRDWPHHKTACKADAGVSGGAGELSPFSAGVLLCFFVAELLIVLG